MTKETTYNLNISSFTRHVDEESHLDLHEMNITNTIPSRVKEKYKTSMLTRRVQGTSATSFGPK
jgi:hypothetical protein